MFAYTACRTTKARNARGEGISVYEIAKDGSLGDVVDVIHLEGVPGKNGEPPKGVSHAHQCEWDKTGRYLFVPTQRRGVGYERIYVIGFSSETGHFTMKSHIDARTYFEPRHVAVATDNRRVYGINEKGNSVTFYEFDEATGTLEARQIVPSLPETYTGQGQASAVLIHPTKPFLYVTNRIHESIAWYRINEQTGYLTCMGWVPCLGLTPRFFTWMPTGELLVANEDSDTIRIFDCNPETGEPVFTGRTIPVKSPTGVVFATKNLT